MNLDYEAAKAESDSHQGGPGLSRHKIKKIVDAAVPKPCPHGNTGRHIDEDSIRMKDWVEGTTGYEDCEYDWCDGKPEGDNE